MPYQSTTSDEAKRRCHRRNVAGSHENGALDRLDSDERHIWRVLTTRSRPVADRTAVLGAKPDDLHRSPLVIKRVRRVANSTVT